MRKKLIVLVVMAALFAAVAVMPAEAAKKKKLKPVAITYFLSWLGDCEGSGYLGLKPAGNEDSCATFFPGLADSFAFPSSEGAAFVLDTTQPITVDFELITVASVAAEYEVVLTGTIGGEEKQIANGTATVLAGAAGFIPVHFDLEPDATLHKATVTALTATVNWTGGVTYAQMDLGSGEANLVIHGFR